MVQLLQEEMWCYWESAERSMWRENKFYTQPRKLFSPSGHKFCFFNSKRKMMTSFTTTATPSLSDELPEITELEAKRMKMNKEIDERVRIVLESRERFLKFAQEEEEDATRPDPQVYTDKEDEKEEESEFILVKVLKNIAVSNPEVREKVASSAHVDLSVQVKICKLDLLVKSQMIINPYHRGFQVLDFLDQLYILNYLLTFSKTQPFQDIYDILRYPQFSNAEKLREGRDYMEFQYWKQHPQLDDIPYPTQEKASWDSETEQDRWKIKWLETEIASPLPGVFSVKPK